VVVIVLVSFLALLSLYMPSLSDSETVVNPRLQLRGKRLKATEPRFRRGAVVSKVDPSPNPQLQGIPCEWIPRQIPEFQQNRPRRRPHNAPNAPNAPNVPQGPPQRPPLPPLEPVNRAGNRNRQDACLTTIIIITILVALTLFGVMIWAIARSGSKPKEKKEATKSSGDWWSAWVIIWRIVVLLFIPARIMQYGTHSLFEMLPETARPRWHGQEGGLAKAHGWILFAGMPLFCLVILFGAGYEKDAICKPNRSIDDYYPIKTRNDLKQIIELWASSVKYIFSSGMGIVQFKKWDLSPTNVLSFGISTVVVSAINLWIGRCNSFRTASSLSLPFFGTLAIAYAVNHAERVWGALRAGRWHSDYIELAFFAMALKILHSMPVDLVCDPTICAKTTP
jgi:hypothetical protein